MAAELGPNTVWIFTNDNLPIMHPNMRVVTHKNRLFCLFVNSYIYIYVYYIYIHIHIHTHNQRLPPPFVWKWVVATESGGLIETGEWCKSNAETIKFIALDQVWILNYPDAVGQNVMQLKALRTKCSHIFCKRNSFFFGHSVLFGRQRITWNGTESNFNTQLLRASDQF